MRNSISSRSILLKAGLFTSLCLSACSTINDNTLKLVGKPAPATRLLLHLDNTDLKNGGTDYVGLSEFKGKTVFLAFWDSACPNSQRMMRKFTEQAKTYANRKDLVFIDVSIDSDKKREAWEKEILEEKFNYTRHAFSGNGPMDEAFSMFKLDAIPSIMVIGPDGRLVAADSSADVVDKFANER